MCVRGSGINKMAAGALDRETAELHPQSERRKPCEKEKQNIRKIAECAAEQLLLHIQEGVPMHTVHIEAERILRDSF